MSRIELTGDFLTAGSTAISSSRLPAQFGYWFEFVFKDQVTLVLDDDLPVVGDVQVKMIPADLGGKGHVIGDISEGAYSPSPVSSAA